MRGECWGTDGGEEEVGEGRGRRMRRGGEVSGDWDLLLLSNPVCEGQETQATEHGGGGGGYLAGSAHTEVAHVTLTLARG